MEILFFGIVTVLASVFYLAGGFTGVHKSVAGVDPFRGFMLKGISFPDLDRTQTADQIKAKRRVFLMCAAADSLVLCALMALALLLLIAGVLIVGLVHSG